MCIGRGIRTGRDGTVAAAGEEADDDAGRRAEDDVSHALPLPLCSRRCRHAQSQLWREAHLRGAEWPSPCDQGQTPRWLLILTRSRGQRDYAAIVATRALNSSLIGLT